MDRNIISCDQPMKCSNLHIFLLTAYAAVYLTPILSGMVHPVLVGGLIALSLLLYLGRRITGTSAKLYLLCLFWLCYCILGRMVGWSSAAWGNYLMQCGFYFTIMAMCFVKEYMSAKQKKTLAHVLILIITINLIDNIRLNTIYPGASVDVVRIDWYPHLAGLNIGSTRFSTTLLFFFGATLFVCLSTKDKKQKLLFALLSLLTAYYLIYQGMRASVTFLLVFLLGMMLYTKRSAKRGANGSGVIVFVVVCLSVFIFLVPILSFLRDLINVPRITERINDVINSLENGVDGESFSGRSGLYMISLRTFYNNMIFGIGDHRGELIQVEDLGIGGHAEFVDLLARYGVVGLVVLLCILFMAFLIMRRHMQSRLHLAFANEIFLVFLICGFMKAVIYPEVGVVLFLLFPNIQYVIRDDCSKTDGLEGVK